MRRRGVLLPLALALAQTLPAQPEITSAGHPTAAAGASRSAGASCSRARVLSELRRRRRLGRGAERFARIGRIICADLTGDGRRDVAFALHYGGSGGNVQWGIFRRLSGGRLRLVLIEPRRRPSDLFQLGIRREGSQVAVLDPIHLDGDPNCCPSGGYLYRRFGWNGRRFVVLAEEILDDIPPGFYR